MTIKQAMILAAGKGTRMRPLTLTTPKPLVEVGGQPLILWHILALKASGITNITINSSWLSDVLVSALGDGQQFGVHINWSIEEQPLETAGGIAKALAENKLQQEPFVLVNGDVWTTFDFSSLVQSQLNNLTTEQNKLAYLLLIDNPEHNPQGDFILSDGLVNYQQNDTNHDASKQLDTNLDNKLTFSGISVIHPELLEGVDYSQPVPLAPILKKAMDNKQVTGTKIAEKWVDVGTPERLAQVNDYIANQLEQGIHKGQQ